MKSFLLLLLFIPLSLHSSAQAQDRSLEGDPGYVDAQTIEAWFDVPPTVEINLKGALLEMVAEASRGSNPELGNLLQRLKAIQVRSFNLDGGPSEETFQRADALIDRLESEGWETIVRVREEDERVNIQLKMEDDAIAGLVVMVLEPQSGESNFVNIVGSIRPEDIGRLGRTLDIDPLKDVPTSEQMPQQEQRP